MDFVAYLGVVKGLKHPTVRGYLSSIRFYHLEAGLPDPTKYPKVSFIMRGLKRYSQGSTPKRPVTPKLLLHILSRLNLSIPCHSYVWAALLTGYMFMLRASEYLGESSQTVDKGKALRRKDILFLTDGKPVVNPDRANQVQIFIRSSKTDQYGAGVYRVLDASGEDICVVDAIRRVYKLGSGYVDSAPLFLGLDGKMVTRGTISNILKRAAADLGEPEAAVSSHSLRGGGATALYNAGHPVERIMYLGRWASDAWMIYVKMTRECLADVSKDLATATYSIAGPLVRGQQEGWEGPPPGVEGPTRGGGPVDLQWGTENDLDSSVRAWRDPDPEDPGVFVLINVQYDRKSRARMGHYVRKEVWDQTKRHLPTDPAQRVARLARDHTVYVSMPREVEKWIRDYGISLRSLGGGGGNQ